MADTKKRESSVISVKRTKGDDGREFLSFKLHGQPEKDQQHVPVLDEIKFYPESCSEVVRQHAQWHGFEQRLRDRAAKPCDPKTGKSASGAEKFKAIRELADFYASGTEQWNLNRGPQGPREPGDDVQMLKAALGIVKQGKTAEQIHEFVSKLTKPQVTALLAKAEVKEAVELIRAQQAEELAAQGVDTDKLLEDF